MQAIDLRYQYVDPQANGAETHPVELPQYSNFGTNHAFLNKADGSGQSTKDLSHFQQLAVKQASFLRLQPPGMKSVKLVQTGCSDL